MQKLIKMLNEYQYLGEKQKTHGLSKHELRHFQELRDLLDSHFKRATKAEMPKIQKKKRRITSSREPIKKNVKYLSPDVKSSKEVPLELANVLSSLKELEYTRRVGRLTPSEEKWFRSLMDTLFAWIPLSDSQHKLNLNKREISQRSQQITKKNPTFEGMSQIYHTSSSKNRTEQIPSIVSSFDTPKTPPTTEDNKFNLPTEKELQEEMHHYESTDNIPSQTFSSYQPIDNITQMNTRRTQPIPNLAGSKIPPTEAQTLLENTENYENNWHENPSTISFENEHFLQDSFPHSSSDYLSFYAQDDYSNEFNAPETLSPLDQRNSYDENELESDSSPFLSTSNDSESFDSISDLLSLPSKKK